MTQAHVTAKPNRLIHEKSPYLLQHAHNPVDWRPWSNEAFQAARDQNKPVFVSVGYSTCHWCHVMERESFENAEVADLLNRDFISIKVDREERPEVDETCMAAAQILAGQGGWPTSVFLTSDGKPFFAGTYFPAEDHPQMLGFKSVLRAITRAWRERRQEVLNQADQVAQTLRQISAMAPPVVEGQLDRSVIEKAIHELRRSFDVRHGGFGGAPKFPPHQALALIAYERFQGREDASEEMLSLTLHAMRIGGIHDHVGGGFHRYSTDERWLLPHFEKMLYDNAQLARSYADGYLLLRSPDFLSALEGIVSWLRREMRHPQGGFFSALDADSEGVEGKCYLWTRQEILDQLGADEGELFRRIFTVEPGGNYNEPASGEPTGANILHMSRPLSVNAKVESIDENELRRRLQQDLEKLCKVRQQRVPPSCDDKVLTCWNGLMIGALAYAGGRLARKEFIELARDAAGFIEANLVRDGRLMRSWREGLFGPPGFLDDYAYLCCGLLDLHEATKESHWLDLAKRLCDGMQELFADPAGGFFFVGKDQDEFLGRLRSPFDSATPSANSVAIKVLCRLGRLTGNTTCFDSARKHLEALKGFLLQQSSGLGAMTHALSMYLDMAPAAALADQPQHEGVLATSQQGPVTVRLLGETDQPLRRGQQLDLRLVLEIQPPWHVNSRQPIQKDLLPLKVELKASPATLGDVRYPEGKLAQLPFADEPLSVYEGRVEIGAPLIISPAARSGEVEMLLQVHVQPCDDRSCQKPQRHELRFHVTVA